MPRFIFDFVSDRPPFLLQKSKGCIIISPSYNLSNSQNEWIGVINPNIEFSLMPIDFFENYNIALVGGFPNNSPDVCHSPGFPQQRLITMAIDMRISPLNEVDKSVDLFSSRQTICYITPELSNSDKFVVLGRNVLNLFNTFFDMSNHRIVCSNL